jgi:hypothetical protein
MTILYEVRRTKHVMTTKATAAEALAYAQVYSTHPGQLTVHGVERREWLVTDETGLPPTDGAVVLRPQDRKTR